MNKIYCFSNVVGGGDGVALAIAQDGVVLGSHYCSHEGYVTHDLVDDNGFRSDLQKGYADHYPDGYEAEFIANADIDGHEGLQAAFKLNKAQPDEPEGKSLC